MSKYPSLNIGIVALLCLGTGTKDLVLQYRVASALFPEDALAAFFSRPLGLLLATTWIVVGIGLWFERDWARWGVRVLATVGLILSIAMSGFAGSTDKPLVLHPVIMFGLLTWLAWTARFHGEWGAGWRDMRYAWWRAKGFAILAWHRVRRAVGLSYLPWGIDSVVVGAGTRMDGDDFAEYLGYPPAQGPIWKHVASIAVTSNRLVLCDPLGLEAPEANGVIVDDIPSGVHNVELQYARLRGRSDLTVVRARILWREFEFAELLKAGAVLVDSAAICIGDPDEISRLIPMLAESERSLFHLLDDGETSRRFPASEAGRCAMLVFTSGLGDGAYPVFELHENGDSVGILVEMTCGKGTRCALKHRGWRAKK